MMNAKALPAHWGGSLRILIPIPEGFTHGFSFSLGNSGTYTLLARKE
jgi:hypothetical protein